MQVPGWGAATENTTTVGQKQEYLKLPWVAPHTKSSSAATTWNKLAEELTL